MRVVIFCGKTVEDWSPKSVGSGIGGSEEAVINIAREFAKLGNEVTVYNQCGDDEGTYDGVEYKKYLSYRGEACDVLIGWRSADCFKMSKKAKLKIKWLHDTTPERSVMQSRDEGADKVFVLSRYHRRLYPSMPNSDFYITRNGVDLSLFKQKVKRVPSRLFYGSSYDRGLRELLTEWSKIKLANPEATLHIAYGWGTWEAQANADMFKAVKEDMEKLMDQEGITHLGRIGHKELAKEFMEADVWAYPCWFPEISAITAMKAQIGGAIPVVIPTAALSETVQFGIKTDRGYYQNIYGDIVMPEEAIGQFTASVNYFLGLDEKEKEPIRKEMMDWAKKAYGWDTLAIDWVDYFTKELNKKDEMQPTE